MKHINRLRPLRSAFKTLALAWALTAGLGMDRALADSVDVSGYVTSPNDVVGADNTANMTGDMTFGSQTYDCAIPVFNNGFLFSMDSGGNYYNYTGEISGSGGLHIEAGGFGTLHIGGSVGNSYTGPTVVSNGLVSLENSSGNALCGDITVGDLSSVLWSANDQIEDTSNVTLSGTATLTLHNVFFKGLAYSDTLGELWVATGSKVCTGWGGVLIVSELYIDGIKQPHVPVTENALGDGLVRGNGWIEVGGSGAPIGYAPTTFKLDGVTPWGPTEFYIVREVPPGTTGLLIADICNNCYAHN